MQKSNERRRLAPSSAPVETAQRASFGRPHLTPLNTSPSSFLSRSATESLNQSRSPAKSRAFLARDALLRVPLLTVSKYQHARRRLHKNLRPWQRRLCSVTVGHGRRRLRSPLSLSLSHRRPRSLPLRVDLVHLLEARRPRSPQLLDDLLAPPPPTSTQAIFSFKALALITNPPVQQAIFAPF